MTSILSSVIKWNVAVIICLSFARCDTPATNEAAGIATTKEQSPEAAEKTEELKPALNNIRILVPGEYTRPLWSPDGSKVLFTKEGNTGLYYVDIANHEEIRQLNDVKGAGYGAGWSRDGNKIYFNEKENFVSTVKSVSLETKKVTTHPGIHFSAIRSYAQSDGQGLFIQLNLQTLQVEASDPQTGKSWKVTTDEGQFYDPLLSPGKTKVVVHRDAEILIYHADGSGFYKSLGKGIAASWSPDSKYLLAFLDESVDGHQLTNSDLYLLSADAENKWPLTATDDIIEMWPSWNPVKNQIAFSDLKTGQIFIADISLTD